MCILDPVSLMQGVEPSARRDFVACGLHARLLIGTHPTDNLKQGGHFAAIEKPEELLQDQEEFVESLNWGK